MFFFSFFLYLVRSSLDISSPGSYSIDVSTDSTNVRFFLPFDSNYEYYMILSNPDKDLYINKLHQNNKFRVQNQTINFYCVTKFTLYFTVTKITKDCLVVYSQNKFQADLSLKSTGSSNLIYDTSDLSKGESIPNGMSRSFSSTNSVCIRYNCLDSGDEVKIAISNINFDNGKGSTYIISANTDKSYFADAIVSIRYPIENSFFTGLNTLTLNSNNESFAVPENRYIVFLTFDNIFAQATTGNTYVDLLGNTNNVAIYYNTSGRIILHSNQTNTVCKFIIYKIDLSKINYIATIIGKGSYTMYSTENSINCIVSAFSEGSVTISESSAAKSKTCADNGIEYSGATGVYTNPVYSTIGSSLKTKYIKHKVTSQQKNSIEITGTKSKYQSLYISIDGSGYLNNSGSDSKTNLLFTIPIAIVVFTVAAGVLWNRFCGKVYRISCGCIDCRICPHPIGYYDKRNRTDLTAPSFSYSYKRNTPSSSNSKHEDSHLDNISAPPLQSHSATYHAPLIAKEEPSYKPPQTYIPPVEQPHHLNDNPYDL